MPKEYISCPSCAAEFTVSWSNGDEELDSPRFCPFCGEELDEESGEEED